MITRCLGRHGAKEVVEDLQVHVNLPNLAAQKNTLARGAFGKIRPLAKFLPDLEEKCLESY
jgi:hypothetical protein